MAKPIIYLAKFILPLPFELADLPSLFTISQITVSLNGIDPHVKIVVDALDLHIPFTGVKIAIIVVVVNGYIMVVAPVVRLAEYNVPRFIPVVATLGKYCGDASKCDE
jgi:hypothetical protein